jgi:hypothetical protein
MYLITLAPIVSEEKEKGRSVRRGRLFSLRAA